MRCAHCAGNLYLEAVEGDTGRDVLTYARVCMMCGRVQDRATAPEHGYRERPWYLARGVPGTGAMLDQVKGGRALFLWETD